MSYVSLTQSYVCYVHDGQQRLVTLSLLLAVFWDVLQTKPDAKDAVEDLCAMLKPVKSRKEDIL